MRREEPGDLFWYESLSEQKCAYWNGQKKFSVRVSRINLKCFRISSRQSKNQLILWPFLEADLKKKLITIKTHLDELPKNKRDLDEVKSLGDSIRSAWKELDAPTEVINFLKEASEEGASLDLLSENVNKWLKEKGLIKKLKVKISSGQTITQTFR